MNMIFAVAKNCIMLDKESKSVIARGNPRELRDSSTDPRVSSFFNRRSASTLPAGNVSVARKSS